MNPYQSPRTPCPPPTKAARSQPPGHLVTRTIVVVFLFCFGWVIAQMLKPLLGPMVSIAVAGLFLAVFLTAAVREMAAFPRVDPSADD